VVFGKSLDRGRDANREIVLRPLRRHRRSRLPGLIKNSLRPGLRRQIDRSGRQTCISFPAIGWPPPTPIGRLAPLRPLRFDDSRRSSPFSPLSMPCMRKYSSRYKSEFFWQGRRSRLSSPSEDLQLTRTLGGQPLTGVRTTLNPDGR